MPHPQPPLVTPSRPFARIRDFASDHRPALIAFFTVLMLIIAGYALVHLASETSYDAVVAALDSTEPWRIIAALALTALSFAFLSLYDLNAFMAIGRPQPWRQIAPGAVAAYAVAQMAGFGPLSGGAIRLRYYTPLGISPADIARVVGFVVIAFGAGLTLTAAAGALIAGDRLSVVLRLPDGVIIATAVATLAVGAAGLLAAGREVRLPRIGGIVLPGRGLMLSQLAVTALDTLAAAGVLWVLLPEGAIGYPAFVPLYAVALALGILSHVPAGLGVFEAVLLAALAGTAPPAELLAAFALYRLIYQAIPLLVAALAIALVEARAFTTRSPAAAALRAIAGLAPQALAALALVLGAMLVFSGVTPARPLDLDWLGTLIPLPFIEGAHFLASILGAVLMITARGLAFRLDGAWWTALLAALAALVLSLVKAIAVYEAAALAIFAAALVAARPAFDRPSTLLGAPLTWPWIAAVSVVLLAAFALLRFVFDHTEFGAESWLRFELSGEAPRGQRALFGASFLAALAAVWSLLRPRHPPTAEEDPADLAVAIAIVPLQPVAGANLVRMGDKRLLFSEDRQGFVMYGRQGASWIALFDPVGPTSLWPELIWHFVETARASGGRAAFYQVSPENLALYADAGLRFFKLGEQARVDLGAFDLVGKARSGHRNVLSRGPRDGLSVEIMEPDEVATHLDTLEAISDSWLALRGGVEKGFSLGNFTRDYVAQQRAAIMRLDGTIVAFATLMSGAPGEETAIDLMRYVEPIPNVAMEFLFLRLCEMLKAEGWRWFDLGMAPLSGLSERDDAPVWHRLGHALYEQGVPSYSFKGLRGFKNKMQPDWRPRYLAVAGGANAGLVLLDATRLIARAGKSAEE